MCSSARIAVASHRRAERQHGTPTHRKSRCQRTVVPAAATFRTGFNSSTTIDSRTPSTSCEENLATAPHWRCAREPGGHHARSRGAGLRTAGALFGGTPTVGCVLSGTGRQGCFLATTSTGQEAVDTLDSHAVEIEVRTTERLTRRRVSFAIRATGLWQTCRLSGMPDTLAPGLRSSRHVPAHSRTRRSVIYHHWRRTSPA